MNSKNCGKCKLEKLFSNFTPKKNNTGGTYLSSICKQCKAEYDKEYRLKNKEKRSKYNKQYDFEHLERRVNYRKKYYLENKEKRKEWLRKYYLEKKHEYLARDSKRRCLELKAIPPWADLEKIKLFYAFARQLTAETKIKYVVDHILPLQGKLICGLHVENNLQIITSLENSIKNNKFTIE